MLNPLKLIKFMGMNLQYQIINLLFDGWDAFLHETRVSCHLSVNLIAQKLI